MRLIKMTFMIANTPKPPYYAVIFSSVRTENDTEGYAEMAERMVALATEQPGYLGIESARDGLGITVSYWESLEAIRNWKAYAEHMEAQRLGRETWYASFKTRVCKVERDYGFGLDLMVN
jgi:heme-degrading monooxygenase HmoA